MAQLMERVQNLMRERLAWQDRAAQARARPLDSAAEPPVPAAVIAAATLREKSVLCVGEDAMALMLTRKVVEMAGGATWAIAAVKAPMATPSKPAWWRRTWSSARQVASATAPIGA
ncbi:hypothetical protein WJ971_21850 [Achromobacter xylosoxidans]